MSENETIEVLGCRMHRLTMDQTVDQCLEWIRAGSGTRHIVTVNASILVKMRTDGPLKRAIRSADLVVSDGASVVWASRLLRQRLPQRVAGVDLMDKLLIEAGRHRLRVYFLGAQREVVRELVAKTMRQHPGLVVAGYRDGYFGPDLWDAVIRDVRGSGADILFVGMPTPFKEVWCQEHLAALGIPVALGVGGSFDVLAGFVRRAPKWMQRCGLEWSWRLLMEPRRLWRRYLVTNTQFLVIVARELWARALPVRLSPD